MTPAEITIIAKCLGIKSPQAEVGSEAWLDWADRVEQADAFVDDQRTAATESEYAEIGLEIKAAIQEANAIADPEE